MTEGVIPKIIVFNGGVKFASKDTEFGLFWGVGVAVCVFKYNLCVNLSYVSYMCVKVFVASIQPQ